MVKTYESRDEWYAALQSIAGNHGNRSAIRDRNGWTDQWESASPEETYYSEFPEDRPAPITEEDHR